MAIYEVTAPNGQVLEIEGDTPPSEAELDEIFNTTNTTVKEPVKNKGIDLTPSGLYKSYRAALEVPATQLREKTVNGKDLSFKEAYQQNREYQDKAPLNKVLGPIVDIGAGLMLPEVKAFQGAGLLPRLGNYGLTGLEQGSIYGGLGGLKENGIEGLLPGTIQGGAIGLGLGLGLPTTLMAGGKVLSGVGDVGKKVIGKIAQISPETVEQVIKPTSKALDYTRDKAQEVLRATTERVRNAYNNLLGQKGEAITTAEENLRNIPERVNGEDVINDIKGIFNQYQGDKINTARNMTNNLEDDLIDLVNRGTEQEIDEFLNTLSPIDLQRIKQQIGQMTNWQDVTRPKIQNTILEQVYGKLRNKLENLSPELAQANSEYAALKGFQNDEGLKTILAPGNAIDRASTTLKNYNSTVSKGNTAQNIQALENTLIEAGEAPFLSTMDDINAATDLLKNEKTGLGSVSELAKSLISRPALRVARWYNRSNLPERFNSVGRQIPRALVPLLYGGPRLYGGISND